MLVPDRHHPRKNGARGEGLEHRERVEQAGRLPRVERLVDETAAEEQQIPDLIPLLLETGPGVISTVAGVKGTLLSTEPRVPIIVQAAKLTFVTKT
jgi:hypothetical protein